VVARRPADRVERPRLAAAGAVLLVAAAWAHSPAPEDVIAALRGPQGRDAGVVAADRDGHLARLLVVRVGPAWAALAPARQRALAEDWRRHWRTAVPDGVVGVVDAASGRPVVNYDARGRARLPSPPAPP
jgi:hypothetical protein